MEEIFQSGSAASQAQADPYQAYRRLEAAVRGQRHGDPFSEWGRRHGGLRQDGRPAGGLPAVEDAERRSLLLHRQLASGK